MDSKTITCPVWKRCGGCRWQGVSYEKQLSIKMQRLIRILGGFGHVSEITGMQDPYHYRCRVNMAVGRNGSAMVYGRYETSTHRIVRYENCLTENKKVSAVMRWIAQNAMKRGIVPFDDDTMNGDLRHVQFRIGMNTDEVLVTLVVYREDTAVDEAFARDMADRFPDVRSVVLNINGKYTSAVLGKDEKVLYGDGYIRDSLLGKTFRISSGSFYQVNPVMAELVYSKALDMLMLKKTDRLIDAYCGTGTIGIIASDRVMSVTGIENNSKSIKDAEVNARINRAHNITFVKADASVYMSHLASDGERIDALIMDPPRSGSSIRFMNSLKTLSPERVAYISCDPESLARDLRWMTRNGYSVKKIQPFDMFPYTDHVEVVTLITRT